MTSVEITDDIRRRVYREDCARLGHQVNFSSALTTENRDDGRPAQVVASDDPLKLPHITCTRCGHVWIVTPAGGWSYEDAERLLYGLLRADTDLAQLIVRNRGAALAATEQPPAAQG